MRALIALLITAAVLAVAVTTIILGIGFFLSPQSQPSDADLIIEISGGETKQRTAEAVRLYDQGFAKTILFSGAAADTSGPSNAAAMKADAVAHGVPADAIMIEEESATTTENALRTAPILKSMHAKTIILVTSPYHQRRANLNFRKILGSDITILNHSATDSAWRKSTWWQHPGTFGLTMDELQKTAYVWLFRPKLSGD